MSLVPEIPPLPPQAFGLPFTARLLLAPMEGITDPIFRDLVLGLHEATDLGGATTEFLRISEAVPSPRVISNFYGRRQHPMPVVLQVMGEDPEKLAETARRAVARGVPMIDLNCGCPAKGALRGCAGSALLAEPKTLRRLVAAIANAVPEVPVSAKIRTGIADASRVCELARAVEDGGARLLTVHYRTRAEAYCEERHWERIGRAVQAVQIPVCGNGSVLSRADALALMSETGSAFAMIGRGALADPWVFNGKAVTASEAARFLLQYAETLRGEAAATLKGRVARLKQLLRYWTAGGLIVEGERSDWLREEDGDALLGRLAAIADLGAPA